MKPHAAQVVAIRYILNFRNEDYRVLQNHFVEILTGEGKSTALGVTAIILAMMNCNVACICYSSYLSERDVVAFRSMFEGFEVLPFVDYITAKIACGNVYNQGVDIRDLYESVAWESTTKYHSSPNESSRLSVLLRTQKQSHFTVHNG